jgi:hypothetical protein
MMQGFTCLHWWWRCSGREHRTCSSRRVNRRKKVTRIEVDVTGAIDRLVSRQVDMIVGCMFGNAVVSLFMF